MSSSTPTIAFFGATGGVVNGTIVHALREGRNVVALVRTASKLTAQLQAQGLSEAVLSKQLTIVTGSALDINAVKSTLTANKSKYLVPQIVTGLGAAPSFQFNWSNPLQLFTIDQPSLCGDAAKTLVAALNELYLSTPVLVHSKPKLTFVSTTGISNGAEDVPWGLRTLYHNLLAVPHIDKRVMEATFRENAPGKDAKDPVFSGVIGLRPTLLSGGVNADEGVGLEKLRIGREAEPATGWSVNRADVGRWMWTNVVGDENNRSNWEGEMVTLTS